MVNFITIETAAKFNGPKWFEAVLILESEANRG